MHTPAMGGHGTGAVFRSRTVFPFLLLFATAAPPLFMAAGYELLPAQAAVFQPGLTALAFLGGGHVAVTFWFYLDTRARDVLSAAKLYYYLAPLLLMGATCGLYVWLSPESRRYAYALFALSAQWHHARQNVGVYGFLSQAWGLGRVLPIEKRILSLSFAGSVLAGVRWYDLPVVNGAALDLLYVIGAVCYLLVVAAAGYFGLREYRRHARLAKTILFLCLSAFFLPAFLFRTAAAASSFAAAHAVQYYLLMWYVIYRSPDCVSSKLGLPGRPAGWITAIAISALWPAAVLFVLSGLYMEVNRRVAAHFDGGIDAVVFGVVMGWVLTHYLVDAGVWRMGDPKVRRYHSASFAFLR